jgi:hypothetical protein
MFCGHPDSTQTQEKEHIMRSQCNKVWLTILLAGGILAAPAAFANAVRFEFGPTETPSITALFQDVGQNQVQLTITALSLSGNNSVNSIYFNFNPVLDSRNLNFTQTGSIGSVQGLVNTANDSYKAVGGGGKFDINFAFGPTFTTGDVVTYSITCPLDFSVNDFLFLETAAAGRSPTYAAGSLQELSGIVIVQGTPTTTETNNAPDIASTFGLLALGMVAIGLLAQRVRGIKHA